MKTDTSDRNEHGRNRVLVVSSEPVSQDDSSPAGRCWELAESLSQSHDVILALPRLTDLSHRCFAVLYYNRRNIRLLAEGCDVVICDQLVLKAHPSLAEAGRPVITDLDTPAGELQLPPPHRVQRGPLHYLRRLRYYLQAGGWRLVIYQARALIKRKIGVRK